MGSKRKMESIPEDFNTNITVDQNEIHHSTSEKLLGMIINESLTWQNHLYGNSENVGLMRTLGQRIGILSKIRKYITNPKRFLPFVSGLFTSKLIYGITAWGSVFGIPGQLDDSRSAFPKKDLLRLQSLQNKAIRIVFYR